MLFRVVLFFLLVSGSIWWSLVPARPLPGRSTVRDRGRPVHATAPTKAERRPDLDTGSVMALVLLSCLSSAR